MLVAFHNDKTVKAKFVQRVTSHYKADEIIHGTYWENGKGCAVGCTIHSGQHELYESELGIPQALARLEDRIFEGMTNGQAKEWPLRFLKAVKVGADLALVHWQFLLWLQQDNLKHAEKEKMPSNVIAAIQQCAATLIPLTKGLPVDSKAARSAESAARSAESAARSVAWSAARSAESAAESAESAAESAARSVAWSAARSAESAAESARSAAYKRMADKLIELIEDAPLVKKKAV